MKQQGVSFYLTLRLCLFILATLSATAVSAQQQELNFCLLVSNGEQRTAYLEEIRRFERLHPQINVNMRAYGSEEYKQRLEGWLKAEKHSDVMYWFGGERLNWFIRSGLVHSLDQLWPDRQWGRGFTDAAQSVVTYQGRVYAVPMHYYHWGIYYKKSLFERLNLTPPEDWQAFLEVGQRLKERGVTPIALGSKEFWPLAGWFDYLNLRINGLDFHQDLLRGMVSYQDAASERPFSALE